MLRWSRYNVTVDLDDDTFVYNGVSGALIRVAAPVYAEIEEVLAGEELRPERAEVLTGLVATSIVVSDTVDELDRLERRYEYARCGGPFVVSVVPTVGCNFDCPYCYEDKTPGFMQAEVAEAIEALVVSQLHRGHVHVAWFGGEPLLAARQLLDLSDRLIARCAAAGAGYSAEIVTNGWYLDGSMARELAARRVASAQVTIDGPPQLHDRYRPHANGAPTYERIMANLAEAVDHVQVNLRVNVDRGNVAGLDELLDDVAARGLANRLSVGFAKIGAGSNAGAPGWAYPTGSFGTVEFATVETALESHAAARGVAVGGLPQPIDTPCGAARPDGLVIGPRGEVWRCWEDVGNDANIVGNILDGAAGFVAPNDHVARFDTFSPFRDDECRTCIALPVCMGGCPAATRHAGRDEQCGTFRHNHRERVERVVHQLAGHPVRTHPLPPAAAMAVPVTLRQRGAA